MTKRQVRAAMRRLREHYEEAEEDSGEINLVPYMDIVTNIIIFLLASVVSQVPLGNVNVSAPTIGAGGGVATEEKQERPLNLTVTVGSTGFTIAAAAGVLDPIPKLPNGKYDFKALTQKLMEIKKEFPTETKGIFNADGWLPYENVVETLDAMRTSTDGKVLFPDVVFNAGIM